ncbi:MAG: hypothetical protein Q9221_008683 [Calogaya cf. arnoldii]
MSAESNNASDTTLYDGASPASKFTQKASPQAQANLLFKAEHNSRTRMAAQSSSTDPAEAFDLWPLPDETEINEENTDIEMSNMLEEILKRENNAGMVLEAEEPKIAERRSREIQKVLAFVTEVNKRKARFVELKTKAGETDLRGKAKQGL